MKDLIVCGVCGRNYFAKFKPVKGGDKVYICSGRSMLNGNCGNAGVNISLVESAIANEIMLSDSILNDINQKDEIKLEMEKELDKIINQIKINTTEKADKDKERIANNAMFRKGYIKEEEYVQNNNEFNSKIENINIRLKIAEKRERQLRHALKVKTSIKSTQEILKKAKGDREELRAIFKGVIHKVIINKISDDIILANTYFKVADVVLPSSLKLYLDVSGMRKRNKNYRYLPVINDNNKQTIYDGNILKTPIADIERELFIIHENAGLLDIEYVEIDKKNVLEIPISNKK